MLSTLQSENICLVFRGFEITDADVDSNNSLSNIPTPNLLLLNIER